MQSQEIVQLHFLASLQQGGRGATQRLFGISTIKADTKSEASAPVARLVGRYQTHIDLITDSVLTSLPNVAYGAMVNAGAMQSPESNRLPALTEVQYAIFLLAEQLAQMA